MKKAKASCENKIVKLLYQPAQGANRVIRGKIIREDTEFFYILPVNHLASVGILKNQIICITPVHKSRQNNRVESVSRSRRANNFSYSKWWKREKVEEGE